MKKSVLRFSSLVLIISILLTAFQIPCSVFAQSNYGTFEKDPIIVRPVTEWESNQVASKSRQEVVSPLSWTDTKGLKLSAGSEYTIDYPANSLAYARYKVKENFVLGDTKCVIMYVKTDSANTVLPAIGYSGAHINSSYDPLMTLGVGKPYSYLPIDGKEWISANAVATWKSSSGDTNGDGISDTYFGGMKFDKAFEGYIKFAIADLSNDSPRINKLDRSSTIISLFNLSVSKIGGSYGNVTAGPIFLTNSESNSNILLTPEVEAVPIENYDVIRSGAFGNSVYPIEGSSLSGESLNRNLEWDVSQTQFASISSCRLQFSNINQNMSGTEGFMFYLSVPEKTTTTFILVLEDPKDTSRWRFSYPPSLLPLAGEDYYFLSEGSSVWHSEKLVMTNETGSKYRAGIYFEEGFTGYVKIPYSSLGNDSGFVFNPEKDRLNSLTYYFNRFGGKYGQVIAGPNFFVLNDGINSEIKLKENYKNIAHSINNYNTNKGVEIGKISNDVIINKELKIKGAEIDNDVLIEYATNEEVGPQSKRFINFNYNNEPLSGTEGLLLYVKLPADNLITLSAVLEYPEDKSRWNLSYAPVLSLYEGESCYVLPLGEDKWQKKTLVKASKNKYNGGIEFDTPFEGYIKIPYSALKNDSGLIFSNEKDILKAVTLKFKRLGGSYGSIAVSDTYLLKNNSSSSEISLIEKGEISISEGINGIISADKTTAYSGEKVSVTVTADEGYTLKADGLFIEYTDYLGVNKKIVADYDNYNNTFSFEMPETDAVILKGEFVPIDEQNFALINPIALNENSLELTFREFQNSFSASEKGVLITLEDSLEDKELSANLNDVDIINATFSSADDTFKLNENLVYSDYKVRINNIKADNLRKNYVVKGYQIVDGEYCYTPAVILNYNELSDIFSDYKSFPETSINSSDKKVNCSYIDKPYEELNYANGIKAETDIETEFSITDIQNSSYWFSTSFSPTVITEFGFIGIFVKVPENKANTLYLTFSDDKEVYYTLPSGKEYILVDKKSGEMNYNLTLEANNRNAGVIAIPAGFEGLVCIPNSSLNQQNSISEKTKLNNITYRFGYMGNGEKAVIVGPLVGFKQKTRIDAEKEIIPQLPKGNSDKKIDISLTEMIDDTAILYLDEFDGAENYQVKAYKRVVGGYALISENILFSNSGSISGLNENGEYFISICARDNRDNVLAEYSIEQLVFTPAKDYKDAEKEEIIYDTVDYSSSNIQNSPFVKRSYTTLNAYNSDLLSDNPNRGFRGCIDFFHFNLTDEAIKAEIEKDIKALKDNGFNSNVHVCYFYPGDYLNGDLTTEFFETAQKIFDYLRDNKIQIILRFAYYDVNNFNQRTPTTEEILRHINQLAENGIIEKNKDVLHAFQVGFVGKYGEWHSDTPADTRADRPVVLNTFIEKLLPDNIYAQLRMPNFKDYLYPENSIKYGNRFGFHLDSFYGIMDGTELGSGQYSYGCADWQRHISEASVTPNDAEAYYWQQFDDIGFYPEGYGSAIAAAQLRLTTFSAVNGYLDQNVNASGCFNEWKKLPVTENWLSYNKLPVTNGWLKDNNGNKINRNIYEYIRDYLGYRLSVKELSVVETQKGMNVSFDVMNYGFSAAFNITSNLVLLDSQNNVVYSIKAGNPEEWYGTQKGIIPDGNFITYKISSDMEIPKKIGEYKIALHLVSKSGATARLDNNIPYENGYNILHTFIVTD